MLKLAARPWAAAVAVLLLAGPAAAQIAVSSNDAKATLRDGVNVMVANPGPDTVQIIDMNVTPPRLLAELPVPGSVVGPPMGVAVAPDESFAIVASAVKLDPNDPTKGVNDDRVTVIDLKAKPPRVTQTLQSGAGAAGVSINRAGTLALVANRAEGTVSVFTIANGQLTATGKIPLGAANSGPSQPIFSRDGQTALVTRDGDNRIAVLSVQGNNVEYTKRDIFAGYRPYGLDTVGNGDIAIVANIGAGVGDADTISVIDMKARPVRVVNTVTVGQTPEGLKISPDGRFVAVNVINGSNKPKASPFFNDFGLLKVYRIDGHNLTLVAQSRVGHWCQGIVWSKDSRKILAQCMIENEINMFAFDGTTLSVMGSIPTKGGAAGIRTAEP